MKSKRRSMANNSTASDASIRHDVISDILSRLPVKSIKRFESVSKSWYRLLKSPEFISAHFRRSSSRPSVLIRRFHNPTGSSFYLCVIDGRFSIPREIPFLIALIRHPKIIASCNGLICMDVSPCYASGFVLWNIATAQFRALPSPRINDAHEPIWMVASGFGYNLQNHDFKLVRIVNFRRKGDDLPVVRAEVYSWSTGSWRIKDGRVTEETIGSCVIPEGQRAVTVNGALNWLANGVGKWASRKFVVSFDLATEEFRRIQIPEFSSAICVKVLESKESLAMAVYPALPIYPGYGRSMNKIELWVLNDEYYGGGDGGDVNVKCWTKSHELDVPSSLVTPVGVHNHSELLLKRVEAHYVNLCFYDTCNHTVKTLPICSSDTTCEFFSHVDSLFPVTNAGFEEVEEAQE